MTGLEMLIKAHSGLRWVVLGLIVMGIGSAGWGWLSSSSYANFDRIWGRLSIVLIDLQILLGVVIFFLLDPALRPSLWHPTLMIAAAVSIHGGAIFARRLTGDLRKHYAHLVAYLVGLLLVLLGIYTVRGSLF